MAELFDPGTIQLRRLSNGLTAVVRVDRSAPVVAIVTYLQVGYFDEPDELAGISHVLEHMFFKGTPTRGPGAIAQATKAAGGMLNAATIYDHTSYYTTLPSSSLEQGLAIQSDALINSVIDADELARELQVIIQEARRKLDNPSAVAAESLYELMFDRHRMRRWRIGTEAFLRSLTRAHLCEYYRTMYRGAATILVVAGDVDAEATHRLIEQYYSPLAAGEQSRDFGPDEPEHAGFRLAERAGDLVHSHLEIGWPTPPTLHRDTPALDVLAVLLGQGRASRLYRTVREAGLAHDISARNYTPTALGVFQVSAELEQARVLEALRAVAGAIAGVLRGPDAREVERAVSVLEARALRRLESMEGQANHLAEWQALGDWRLGHDYLEAVRGVTAEAVAAAAARYLEVARCSIFCYRPDRHPPIGIRANELLSQLQAADVLSVAPPGVALRSAAPALLTRRATEDGVHLFEAGALRIFVKQRRSAPLVSIAVGAPGGAVSESAEQAGWTALAARTSVKGTRQRSAFQLALAAEVLGASIGPSVGADLFDWYTSVPSHHFTAALDLLSDVVREPAFHPEELERERVVALADLQQVRDDMYRYPLRLFLEAAFPGHPYGFSLDTSSAAIAAATADRLRGWHEHITRVRELSVTIVGDVDPEQAAQAAAGFLQPHARAKPPVRLPDWPKGGGERIEQRGKAQTAIVLGYPAVDRNHPDLYVLQVLASTIAGLGGRLFEELRSRKSLAYTVTAYPVARQLGGAFIAYIATAPEREDEAIDGLLDELNRVRHDRLPDDDVERAKRYLIGSWQIRSQTNGAQVTDLMNAVLIGRGFQELREYEERIRAVTTEQIRNAAQQYFRDDKLVRALVRGTGGSR